MTASDNKLPVLEYLQRSLRGDLREGFTSFAGT